MLMFLNGYVECNKQNFTFTYDEDILHLVPMNPNEIKQYDFFINRKLDEKLLIGTTTKNEAIVFFDCHLIKNAAGYLAKPSAYIQYCNKQVIDFESIVFNGNVVNFFYRPLQIVDIDNTIYDHINGGATIKLKPFDKIGKEENVTIDDINALLSLSIYLPPNPIDSKVIDNLGNLNSFLRLSLNTPTDISLFSKIYGWMYKLFTFLTFRSSIEFGNIILQNKTSDGKFITIANVYIRKHETTPHIDADSIIGYYFIEEHISSLLNNINSPNINLLFIPETEKEIKYIDPVKYMSCCSSFESAFLFRYGKVKGKIDENYLTAKEDIEAYIRTKINQYKNVQGKGKLRSAYKSLLRTVNLTDFSLADKYKYCLKEYNDIIHDYISNVLRNLGFTIQSDSVPIPVIDEGILRQIPIDFADHRNLLVHDHIEAFLPIHIAGYLIAKCIIYVLLLDSARINHHLIKQSIDIIFK
jgi:hypothetical protein